MAEVPREFARLPNAPIVEALIDFRLRSNEPIDLNKLESFGNAIVDRYPAPRKDNREFQLGFTFGPQNSTQQRVSGQIVGYRFEAPDRQFVLQVNKAGFTLSKLKPYQALGELKTEARSLWDTFTNFVGDVAIVRIAVRYINRIEFPGPQVDLDKYLVAAPKIPPKLPQGLTEFVSRSVVPFADHQATLILTQSLDVAGQTGSVVPVILDIDVFKEGNFDPSKGEQWEILEDLRYLKNLAFFESIPPLTLELFQ